EGGQLDGVDEEPLLLHLELGEPADGRAAVRGDADQAVGLQQRDGLADGGLGYPEPAGQVTLHEPGAWRDLQLHDHVADGLVGGPFIGGDRKIIRLSVDANHRHFHELPGPRGEPAPPLPRPRRPRRAGLARSLAEPSAHSCPRRLPPVSYLEYAIPLFPATPVDARPCAGCDDPVPGYGDDGSDPDALVQAAR